MNKFAWFICRKTQKKMNTKKLLWARSCCLDDINISVGKAAGSNSKQSPWNTSSFIVMLQIWFRRGSYELDPVDLPIEICQLACLQDQVQKHLFEHRPRILCCLCCFKLFTYFIYAFFNFFSMSSSMKTLQKHIMVMFGLYNLN